MTELRANVTPRRLDQPQNGWKNVHQDDEREELRMWMRKKHRERLAVYQKHRDSLREKEHKPFSSTVTVVRRSAVFIVRADSSSHATFRNMTSILFLYRNQSPRIQQLFRKQEWKNKGMYNSPVFGKEIKYAQCLLFSVVNNTENEPLLFDFVKGEIPV